MGRKRRRGGGRIYKEPVTGYHQAVDDFKKQLLATTLRAHNGNRTHAAGALGLQRTYLLRLIRDFQLKIPPPARRRHALA